MAERTLGALLRESGVAMPASISGVSGDVAVSGVAYDSRRVRAGDVFVAIQGAHADGIEFVDDAVAHGAVAIVSDRAPREGRDVPWVVVDDTRMVLSALAATSFGRPSQELLVIGTTGTNGKTTTTYLLDAMLEAAGVRTGRVSSVTSRVGRDERPAERTTPESVDLQRLMRQMVDRGCQACVMEVSSHALALRRVEHIHFGAGIFTNLTRDHLDFHGDMATYFAVKRQLFVRMDASSPAIVNVDDRHGRILAKAVARPVTYAIDEAADIQANRLALSLDGIEMDVRTPRGALQLRSKMIGRANAYNLLAAAAAGTALSLPFRVIEHGLASVSGVPGRMQIVSSETDDVTVVVDFAHTDDALRGVLEAARSLATGRVITVFGCGGDRDVSKRPLMGAVAARMSDLVIVTSDNPRSEDPERIAHDIERGLAADDTPWLTVLDRADAIDQAIRSARAGDLVVIAGKGHETQQIVGSRVLPFEDAVVARERLAARRSGSRVG